MAPGLEGGEGEGRCLPGAKHFHDELWSKVGKQEECEMGLWVVNKICFFPSFFFSFALTYNEACTSFCSHTQGALHKHHSPERTCQGTNRVSKRYEGRSERSSAVKQC